MNIQTRVNNNMRTFPRHTSVDVQLAHTGLHKYAELSPTQFFLDAICLVTRMACSHPSTSRETTLSQWSPV